MIHIEFGPSTIVGIGLTIIGILLYTLRTKEPNVSRDYDLFFSSIGLLCGGILIFQGWRLDPILLLCQILLSGTAIFFIGESIYRRNSTVKRKENLIVINNKEKDLLIEKKSKSTLRTAKKEIDYQSIKIMPRSLSYWQGIYYSNPISYEIKLESITSIRNK